MALFGSIRRLFSSAFSNLRTSLVKWIGTTDVIYVDVDAANAIEKGFNANTAVYAIVTTDTTKFASIPRYVYDKKKEKTDKHPELTVLLNRPNPWQGQDSFLELLRAYRILTGEAFVWCNRGNTEKEDAPILEMYVLPSNHVEIIPDPDDLWGCLGYNLVLSGKAVPLRKTDIIHWKGLTLEFDATTRTHMRGFSPLKAGYKTLQQNNDATDSSVRMYQNDGAKGLLHNKTWDRLSTEQKSQVQGVIDQKINNSYVKGMVATVQGDWGYLDLGNTSVDLQLLEGKQMSWRELCALFGVPYEFFQEGTSFANKEWAQKQWVSNRIIPASKQWDDEYNRVVLKSFGLQDKVYVAADFSELPEMQDDMEKMARLLAMAWWISPNEKLEAMGYEKNPDKIFDEPWIPTGITPLSMAGQDIAPPLTPEEEDEVKELYNFSTNGHSRNGKQGHPNLR